ncbi:amidohydrolase 2 [Mycolicibacterium rhodesiae JS60]|nr:amidohydrolase 2 [Mycolicibacterium rhodesiae JS60]
MSQPNSALVIDSQVHIWGRPTARFPWARGLLDELPVESAQTYLDHDRTGADLLDEMDEAGVDVALLTSPWLYGCDPAYSLQAADDHPGRFGVIAPIASQASGVSEYVASLRLQPDIVGIRVLLGFSDRHRSGVSTVDVFDAALAGARKERLPVFISPMGHFDLVADAAQRFSDVTLVLDHLGLWLDAGTDTRLAMATDVLRLSHHSNIMVKCSAVPELSRSPYPFDDLWPLLHRYVNSFGAERMMWGSDINQHRNSLSYRESIDYLRLSNELSEADRAHILGQTAMRLLPSLALTA